MMKLKFSQLRTTAVLATLVLTAFSAGSESKAPKKGVHADCTISRTKAKKFKRLVATKAPLKRFQKELGEGCRLEDKSRLIKYWSVSKGELVYSVQFQTKTKKFVQERYVVK